VPRLKRRSQRSEPMAFAQGKNILRLLFLYSGITRIRDLILSTVGSSRATIVYYHRIGEPDVLTRSLEDFKADIKYLARRYECISLFELCRRLKAKERFTRPIAVITFDDGYRDNLLQAVPVLQEAKVPATFFVSTGYIGTDREFPHDSRRCECTRCTYPKLTWDDVRHMEELGFEIGSHTVEHTDLGKVTEEVAEWEMRESLKKLNEELGTAPRPFSFPWGKPENVPPWGAKLAERAGYYCSCTAFGGSNGPHRNVYDLRRVDVGNGWVRRLNWIAKVEGLDLERVRRWWGYSPRRDDE
jgi:peptidoglycan/xylan/chitin deacetylase (PgdA/CDA1 family)